MGGGGLRFMEPKHRMGLVTFNIEGVTPSTYVATVMDSHAPSRTP